ncbi:MAG: hypothetical protein ACHQFW_09420 [Chitinophagales bacterium]
MKYAFSTDALCRGVHVSRLILLLSFLLPSFMLFSQEHKVTVELSDVYTEPKNSIVYDVIGYDDGGVVLSRFNRKGLLSLNMSLEKYSHSLKLLSMRDYEFESGGEEVTYGSAFYFHDKVYLFGSAYYKKTKKRNIFTHEVDPKTLTAKGAPKLLKSIQETDNGSIALGDYVLSEDEKTLAFYGLPGYFKKSMSLSGIPIQFSSNKDQIKGSVMVLGKDMEVKYETEFTLPYEEKLYDVSSVKVGNDGNFYVLGRLFNEKAKEKKRGEPNYKYVITTFKNNGKDISEYTVTLDDKFITDCSFYLNDENNIVCAGFYSTKGTYSIKGTFYMVIDGSSKTISGKSTKEFDTEFLKLFMSDNKAEKGNELSNFDLEDIIIREDGGAVLIGEKYYVTQHTTYNASTNSSRTYYVYHYNDIIVININPDNTIEWATRVPKVQASSSGFYLSYAVHVKDEMIYLLFNDNDKNLDEKNPDKIYAYDGKNSIATLATITPDGEYKKSALFSNKEEGVIMRPIVSEQINNDELIIYCEKRRDYVIGKIKFE